MQRIIITGAHGAGKSHLAARFSAARPDVALVSSDTIKLASGWVERPRSEIDVDLSCIIARDAWIIEGGPSVLPLALARADVVIWLDPPVAVRAWRLFTRPLKGLDQTRPDMLSGDHNHLIGQFRFAWRSLRRDMAFRASIATSLAGARIPILNCYTRVDADSAVSLWAGDAPQ